MAYAHHTHHAHEGATLGQRLGQLREELSARLAWHRNYRRTLDELENLSDRELADIGIHRSLIPEIAREAADRA
jgi:uncharacterized protein YjiS (DUF1127 family)